MNEGRPKLTRAVAHPQQAAIFPEKIIAALQAALLAKNPSREIDRVILETEARAPGRYWQSAHIEFLRQPQAVRLAEVRRQPVAVKALKPAAPEFDEASLTEMRRLIHRVL